MAPMVLLCKLTQLRRPLLTKMSQKKYLEDIQHISIKLFIWNVIIRSCKPCALMPSFQCPAGCTTEGGIKMATCMKDALVYGITHYGAILGHIPLTVK